MSAATSAKAPALSPNAPLSIAYLTYRGKPHVGGQGVYTRHLTKALVDLGHTVEVFGGQPYPILDERITLHQLPSLDLWNDHFPGRFPGYWELKSRRPIGQRPSATFEARSVSPCRSACAPCTPCAIDSPTSTWCTTTNASATACWASRSSSRRSPRCITRSLVTAPWRWPTRPPGASATRIGRWYNFVKMQGRVAKRLPRIVVVSENSIKDIHADMGVSLDRMRLVPVGVDPELFTPLPHITRRPGRLITTASADVALKGLSYLLEAMAKLRTERDVTLTIIGKPRDGASNQLIDHLGLRPHIEFVSGVPDQRVVELYAEAELAVVPSLYEGFSLPAIEAMSTGICLVATDGGALPEVTGRDGDTVLQCAAGDVDALVSVIRRGLDDAELRARVGDAGRRRVVERWSWKHCAQLTVEQYREVLAMPHNVEKLRRNGRL